MSESTKATFSIPEARQMFTVEKIIPEQATSDELELCARSIVEVMRRSWTNKFVPKTLSLADRNLKLLSPEEQLERIVHPHNDACYWMAYSHKELRPGLDDETLAQAMIRSETYKPRKPFAKPYPNVTDLETVDGNLLGKYERQAAALLYFALSDYEDDRKIAAYSELPNETGIEFLENLAFRRTGNQPTEQIGSSVMTYVHLEAPSVESVRTSLARQYSWLET